MPVCHTPAGPHSPEPPSGLPPCLCRQPGHFRCPQRASPGCVLFVCSFQKKFIFNGCSPEGRAAPSASLQISKVDTQGRRLEPSLEGKSYIQESLWKRKLRYKVSQSGFLGTQNPVTQDWLGGEPTGALGIGQGWKCLQFQVDPLL